MLRAATPLSFTLFLSFLLFLAVNFSTPIVKKLPLASFGGVDFGVFGFCQGSLCSKVEIGYTTANLFNDTQSSTFDLPSDTRTALSSILIIHPIVTLTTLIMLVLAIGAHFRGPSHSSRYLLATFIIGIFNFILGLLAFLIDVLLFVPHMAFGSYLVLAGTVLVGCSGIISCAMRRTLVSRKARKRRIAENPEMNGENFYNHQGPDPLALTTAQSNTLVNGGSDADKLPTFATFETIKKDSDRSSEERIPLTTRSPSEKVPPNAPPTAFDGYRGAPSRNGNPSRPPREMDEFGNPAPGPPYAPGRDPSMDRQFSDQSMRGRGSQRGRGPQADRGGYGGFGRGGYGRFGAPGDFTSVSTSDYSNYRLPNYNRDRGGAQNGRSGFQPRGGFQRGRGAFQQPPGRGGYQPGGPGQAPYSLRQGGFDATRGRGGRPGPPPAYGQPQNGRGYAGNNYQPSPTFAPAGYQAYNPDDSRSSLPRAESPPPLDEAVVGQAIEMDATTGSPSHAPQAFGSYENIINSSNIDTKGKGREMPTDVKGKGREIHGAPGQGRAGFGPQDQNQYRFDSSFGAGTSSSGENITEASGGTGMDDHDVAGMVGLQQQKLMEQNTVRSSSRYSTEPEEYVPPYVYWKQNGVNRGAPLHKPPPPQSEIPTRRQESTEWTNEYVYDAESDVAPVQPMSPAQSEKSGFTSVSQRGINPRWNPDPVKPAMPDLLSNNPDFALPRGRGGRM